MAQTGATRVYLKMSKAANGLLGMLGEVMDAKNSKVPADVQSNASSEEERRKLKAEAELIASQSELNGEDIVVPTVVENTGITSDEVGSTSQANSVRMVDKLGENQETANLNSKEEEEVPEGLKSNEQLELQRQKVAEFERNRLLAKQQEHEERLLQKKLAEQQAFEKAEQARIKLKQEENIRMAMKQMKEQEEKERREAQLAKQADALKRFEEKLKSRNNRTSNEQLFMQNLMKERPARARKESEKLQAAIVVERVNELPVTGEVAIEAPELAELDPTKENADVIQKVPVPTQELSAPILKGSNSPHSEIVAISEEQPKENSPLAVDKELPIVSADTRERRLARGPLPEIPTLQFLPQDIMTATESAPKIPPILTETTILSSTELDAIPKRERIKPLASPRLKAATEEELQNKELCRILEIQEAERKAAERKAEKEFLVREFERARLAAAKKLDISKMEPITNPKEQNVIERTASEQKTTSEQSLTLSGSLGRTRRRSKLLQVIEHHETRSPAEIEAERQERLETIKFAAYRARQISESAPTLRRVIDDPPPRLGSVVTQMSLDSVDSLNGAQIQVTKMWNQAIRAVIEENSVDDGLSRTPTLPRTPRPLSKTYSANPEIFTDMAKERKIGKRVKSRKGNKCSIL